MWRLKYLLIGMLISGVFGAILFFVGRFALDEIRDEFQQDAVAAVQDGFRANDPGPITQERITISERQLTDALARTDASSDAFDEDGLAVDLVPGEIRVVAPDDDGSGSTTFAAVRPTIESGRVELGEPDGFVALVLPMGAIADEIELQTTNVFNENNVTPTGIEITDTELIILVEPKPGATLGTPEATPRAGATPAGASGTAPRPAVTPTAGPRPTEAEAEPTTARTTATPATARTVTPGSSARTPTAEPTPTRIRVETRPRTPSPTAEP